MVGFFKAVSQPQHHRYFEGFLLFPMCSLVKIQKPKINTEFEIISQAREAQLSAQWVACALFHRLMKLCGTDFGCCGTDFQCCGTSFHVLWDRFFCAREAILLVMRPILAVGGQYRLPALFHSARCLVLKNHDFARISRCKMVIFEHFPIFSCGRPAS